MVAAQREYMWTQMHVFIYKACINVMEILFYSGFQQSLYFNMELICPIRPFLGFQMVQIGKWRWQHDGGVWFQNGWCEFASCHGVTLGHLLVFKYIGNSHFDVLIFDATATEIDYTVDDQVQPCRVEDNESDDDSVQILDVFTKGEGSGMNLTLL